MCLVCYSENLENGYHLLLFCEQYEETRAKYLQEIVDKTDIALVVSQSHVIRCLMSKETPKISGQ